MFNSAVSAAFWRRINSPAASNFKRLASNDAGGLGTPRSSNISSKNPSVS